MLDRNFSKLGDISMKKRTSGLTIALVLLSGAAFAQEEAADAGAAEMAPAEDAAPEDAAPEDAVADEQPAEVATVEEASTELPGEANGPVNTPRFRFGISGGGGFLTGPVSGGYGGVDLRLGVQVNDLLGIYVQPQLGYYGADGYSIGGGLAGFSGVAEVTLIDRIFVGAGGGLAVLNNPSGPEAHFRVGGYPVMKRSAKGVTRKGLSLAIDLRLFFVSGFDVFVSPTFNIGYEAF